MTVKVFISLYTFGLTVDEKKIFASLLSKFCPGLRIHIFNKLFCLCCVNVSNPIHNTIILSGKEKGTCRVLRSLKLCKSILSSQELILIALEHNIPNRCTQAQLHAQHLSSFDSCQSQKES